MKIHNRAAALELVLQCIFTDWIPNMFMKCQREMLIGLPQRAHKSCLTSVNCILDSKEHLTTRCQNSVVPRLTVHS